MKDIIELLWEDRGLLDKKEYSDAVLKTIELLDKGAIRIAEKVNNCLLYTSPSPRDNR